MDPSARRLTRVLSWYERQQKTEEKKLHAAIAAAQDMSGQVRAVREHRRHCEREVLDKTGYSISDLTSLENFRTCSLKAEAKLTDEERELLVAVKLQQAMVIRARRKTRLVEQIRHRRLLECDYKLQKELEQAAEDTWRAAQVSFDDVSG
jgi:hypothetical protein